MKKIFSWFSTCCPHCKSIDFRDAGPQNGFERALQRFIEFYRCSLCGHAFRLIRRPMAVRRPV